MKIFLDTNILAYQFASDFPEKQMKAREIIREHAAHAVISTQVLLELSSVLTRKLGFSRDEVLTVLEAIDLDVVGADTDLVLQAARMSAEHQLSIFDAMIVEAAVRAECSELWTEDLATGTNYSGVRIVNPFI